MHFNWMAIILLALFSTALAGQGTSRQKQNSDAFARPLSPSGSGFTQKISVDYKAPAVRSIPTEAETQKRQAAFLIKKQARLRPKTSVLILPDKQVALIPPFGDRGASNRIKSNPSNYPPGSLFHLSQDGLWDYHRPGNVPSKVLSQSKIDLIHGKYGPAPSYSKDRPATPLRGYYDIDHDPLAGPSYVEPSRSRAGTPPPGYSPETPH